MLQMHTYLAFKKGHALNAFVPCALDHMLQIIKVFNNTELNVPQFCLPCARTCGQVCMHSIHRPDNFIISHYSTNLQVAVMCQEMQQFANKDRKSCKHG